MTVMVLSQSQIDAYLRCKQLYGYAYIDKLQPKTAPRGIARGNCVHTFFETFLKSIKAGKGTEESMSLAVSAIMGDPNAPELMPKLVLWVQAVWPTLGWKIVEVEREYRVPISPTLVYPFKVDAIVEIKGKLVLIDHKALYDFFTQEALDIMPQMPKYIGSLRHLGIKIAYGQYNIIRTREVKDFDLKYDRPVVNPTPQAIATHMREQILTMKEIESGEFLIKRTASSYNCKGCKFIELCTADLNGQETKYIRAHSYEPSTYGYTEEPE